MPTRIVHHADGIAWLRDSALADDHAIVTSLPDSTELRSTSFEQWQTWFTDAAELACRSTADEAVTIFFQTDVKRDGVWIDKSFLVHLGARAAGVQLLWHKVVARAPAGIATHGRPGYAHLLCFSRALRLDPKRSSPDVLPSLGTMTWSHAMGLDACEATCSFLLDQTSCRTVVDPFCGVGSILAVANAHGMDAVGVELSAKRAEKARVLDVSRDISH